MAVAHKAPERPCQNPAGRACFSLLGFESAAVKRPSFTSTRPISRSQTNRRHPPSRVPGANAVLILRLRQPALSIGHQPAAFISGIVALDTDKGASAADEPLVWKLDVVGQLAFLRRHVNRWNAPDAVLARQ
jgi:hypothetical protein